MAEWSDLKSIALVVLVIVVFIAIFKGPAEGAPATMDPILVSSAQQACSLKGLTAARQGIDFDDCDEDGLPDVCDRCIDGDDSIDANLNGISDLCEVEDEQSGKVRCKYVLESNPKVCGTGISDWTVDDPVEETGKEYTLQKNKCPSAKNDKEFVFKKVG